MPATATPAQQLAGLIGKFDPAVARVIRSSRAALRKRYPTAVELVYDNDNALTIGWGATEHASDAFVSLAATARGVILYGRMLQGSGNRGRFVRLPSAATLNEPAVDALLRAATKSAKAPLPSKERGPVVIESVSARQRARRKSPR